MDLSAAGGFFEAAVDFVLYNLNILACDKEGAVTVVYKFVVLKSHESRLLRITVTGNQNLPPQGIRGVKYESVNDRVIIDPIGNVEVCVIECLDYYLVTLSRTQCEGMIPRSSAGKIIDKGLIVRPAGNFQHHIGTSSRNRTDHSKCSVDRSERRFRGTEIGICSRQTHVICLCMSYGTHKAKRDHRKPSQQAVSSNQIHRR